jgi:hypothetical protein
VVRWFVQRPKRLSGMVVRRITVMSVGGESEVSGEGCAVKEITQRAPQAGIWEC